MLSKFLNAPHVHVQIEENLHMMAEYYSIVFLLVCSGGSRVLIEIPLKISF